MKKSRFTEEQTTYALRQADSGKPVGLYAGRLSVPEAPFYTWKKKYADLGVSELRKLKLLEDENVRLGQLTRNLRSLEISLSGQGASTAWRKPGIGIKRI